MKKLFYCIALSSMMLSMVGCGNGGNQPVEDKNVDVILISGQSNAVGCTKVEYIAENVGFQEYQEYLNGYPEIQIAFDSWTKYKDDWNNPAEPPRYFSQNKSKNDNFVKVTLGQGNSLETFGPEIGIAEATHESHANKLFLIKYACGASNLKDDWLEKNSPMYPRLIEYVKKQMSNLTKKGYKPTLKAFCWMQGEGDSYSGYYQYYQENLRTFVGNVRNDLAQYTGGVELPFIDAAISLASNWPSPEKVNEAKAAFAAESPNNYFIDTVAQGLHTDQEPWPSADTAHYDSESQIKLGHLFAEAFEPFLIN